MRPYEVALVVPEFRKLFGTDRGLFRDWGVVALPGAHGMWMKSSWERLEQQEPSFSGDIAAKRKRLRRCDRAMTEMSPGACTVPSQIPSGLRYYYYYYSTVLECHSAIYD
jgi:hypothetical protein